MNAVATVIVVVTAVKRNNMKCKCVNCECDHCGSQNPERLTGAAAKKAGVTDWTHQWDCCPKCQCCDK